MLNPIHFIIKLTFKHTGNMREFLRYLLNKLSVVTVFIQTGSDGSAGRS